MIDLFILDSDLNLLGEVSEYINLEFDRRVDTYSQVIINIQATDEILRLMKTGNIVSPQSNPSYGYIIEHINYTQAGSEEIEVVAFSLNYLLSFRTIYPQQYYSGTHEDVIRRFVTRNAISPVESYRAIPRLTLGAVNNVGTSIRSSRTGGNLLEHVMSIANEVNGSVDILMNFGSKMFELIVWQGANRSATQNVNPKVVFSENFDNILQQSYYYSLIDYKGSPIVAGEGEGVNRTLVNLNETAGLNRREIFVDARDLQSEYQDEEGVTRNLSVQEYTDALISRGNEAIQDTKIVETFEADVENTQFVYGKDYFVGDVVSVKNIRLDIILNVPVTSIKTISNSSGVVIKPSLGTGIPDLYRRGGK